MRFRYFTVVIASGPCLMSTLHTSIRVVLQAPEFPLQVVELYPSNEMFCICLNDTFKVADLIGT